MSSRGSCAAPANEVSSGEFVRCVARMLDPHKRPRAVRFVNDLPHNALGKVQKNRLPRRWARDTDQRLTHECSTMPRRNVSARQIRCYVRARPSQPADNYSPVLSDMRPGADQFLAARRSARHAPGLI